MVRLSACRKLMMQLELILAYEETSSFTSNEKS